MSPVGPIEPKAPPDGIGPPSSQTDEQLFRRECVLSLAPDRLQTAFDKKWAKTGLGLTDAEAAVAINRAIDDCEQIWQQLRLRETVEELPEPEPEPPIVNPEPETKPGPRLV